MKTTTQTEGRIKVELDKVCTVWLPVTYSKKDTEQTKIEAKANNKARTAYGCSK